jgi:hypothetical protein
VKHAPLLTVVLEQPSRASLRWPSRGHQPGFASVATAVGNWADTDSTGHRDECPRRVDEWTWARNGVVSEDGRCTKFGSEEPFAGGGAWPVKPVGRCLELKEEPGLRGAGLRYIGHPSDAA